jgi:hypothetical protein
VRKLVLRSLGVLSILLGLSTIPVTPLRFTLKCERIKQTPKFCTYAFSPTFNKSQCIPVQDQDVICEGLRDYLLPDLYSSMIVKDPNGSPIINSPGPGDSSRRSRPNFSVINYKTRESLILPNFSNNSREGIDSYRKDFHQFLKEKDRKNFSRVELQPVPWILPMIGTACGLLGGVFCFQNAVKSRE